MPQYISKLILNGVTQMDVTQDTVAANNLLQGETATKNDGSPVVGAYVPASPTLQTITKTYTPSTAQQTETITPSVGYDGIGEVDVTVSAVPTFSGPIDIDVGFDTVNNQRVWKARGWVSADVGEDGYIPEGDEYGEYTYYDAIAEYTSVTPTESAQTIGGANYMMEGAVTVNAISSTYVGSGVARKSSSDLTASGATVTAPAGYYANSASKTVASGSATPAASISGTSATVSTGTNTLTLSKTVSNTPQVSAGYVSNGTAGNTNVSLTANVTTKAAATITPGTTNQTIASGTYLTGTQTISGDANLVAGNIKNGTPIFGVTGTYEGSNPVKTKTGTFTGNGTRTIDVACDFEPDLVYFTSDPGTSASSGTVAAIIARDMMAATRYRNNSTSNSHYAVTPCVNLNTSGSSYSWRATYASNKVTLYCFSSGTRSLLTNGRTYTYKFVKWTT